MIKNKIEELQQQVDSLLNVYKKIEEVNIAKKSKVELLIEISENMLQRDIVVKEIESKRELIKRLLILQKKEYEQVADL